MTIIKKIKVLEITGGLDCGGIETLLVNILKDIDKKKFQIDFFVTAKKEYFYSDTIKKLGSNIYSYPFKIKNLLLSPFYITSLVKILLKNKYDVVHCHHNFINAVTIFIAWCCGVKKRISHSHTELKIKTPKILKKIFTLAARKLIAVFSTDMLACSKEAGISMYGNNKKFDIIYNGIDTEKFKYNKTVRKEVRKEYNIENSLVIGHVGRFSKEKNHKFLIDVFNEIYKKDNSAVLILCGDGPLKKDIENYVNKLKISDKVIFTGSVNDINKFYQAMDIFIMPSLFEGLGIAAVEAQVSGLLCFLSDKIPKSVKIADNICFLDINKSANFWTGQILNKYKNFVRKDTINKINDIDFTLKTTVNRIEELYLKQNEK